MNEQIKKDIIKFAGKIFQTLSAENMIEEAQKVKTEIFEKYGNGKDNGAAEAVWQMSKDLVDLAI